MMNADDVLNQAAQGQLAGSKAMPPLPGFRIGQFFEDLVDRELQLLARLLRAINRLASRDRYQIDRKCRLRMAAWLRSREWTELRWT